MVKGQPIWKREVQYLRKGCQFEKYIALALAGKLKVKIKHLGLAVVWGLPEIVAWILEFKSNDPEFILSVQNYNSFASIALLKGNQLTALELLKLKQDIDRKDYTG